jgi:hypothetical protein
VAIFEQRLRYAEILLRFGKTSNARNDEIDVLIPHLLSDGVLIHDRNSNACRQVIISVVKMQTKPAIQQLTYVIFTRADLTEEK